MTELELLTETNVAGRYMSVTTVMMRIAIVSL